MVKRTKKIMSAVIVAMMFTTTNFTAYAASNDGWTEAPKTSAAQNGAWENWCSEWERVKNDWTQLSITPGINSSELNFAWYSRTGSKSPKVKISKSKDMKDAAEFSGTQSDAVKGYMSNKVTVKGLEEKTIYYYCYGTEGKWSEVVEIKTQSTDKFGFFLAGDPQIGSSLENEASDGTGALGQDKSARNDSFNWNNTINKALSLMPDASFLISAGDQVSIRNKKATAEEAKFYDKNEIEYAGYLSPKALKSLPVATSLGNHDAVSGNYSYHFNNPNASKLGSTAGGGDYYYTYGNTLFIMLNTNNTNIAEHKQFIEEAVSNAKDAKWRVVTLHQDIYGSGEHSHEPQITELRYSLVPILEESHIDVVLTGHDHTYARSKILKGGVKDESTFLSKKKYDKYFDKEFSTDYKELVNDEEYLNYLKSIGDKNAVVTDLNIQSGKVIDPKGILYITANSASGSKYYKNVPRQQDYVASRWQEDVPTFSTINVDDVSLSISTYRTDNLQKIDETYTIVKSIDKSNLDKLIKDAKQKNKDEYTSSTWKTFEGALTNAKAVSAQADAGEKIVTEAYTDLNTAMNSLVKKFKAKVTNKDNSALADGEKSDTDTKTTVADKGTDTKANAANNGGGTKINTSNNSTNKKPAAANSSTSAKTSSNGVSENVKTGDNSYLYIYVILALSTAGLATIKIRKKKHL